MQEIKVSKWHGRLIRYVPLILWIGVIFFLSSNSGSMSNTSRFIRPLLEFLFPNADEALLLIYHGYIRKAAHVTEYGILAFLASLAFYRSAKPWLNRFWYLFAALLVFLVASIDEVNQSFNMNRTGTAYDVLIDLLGGLLMIIILAAVFRKKKINSA